MDDAKSGGKGLHQKTGVIAALDNHLKKQHKWKKSCSS